ncbi:MAG: hypothetical protein LLG40_15755 [Deltaproteobacteria bacterium]|nr:hypothetical protein [Deltaproteobacteria bacterium]
MNTVTIQLSVKDDGTVVVKQFGKTTEETLGKVSASAKNTASSMNVLKGSFLDLSAKAAAGYLLITQAMDKMDKGVKAEQAEASFRSLAATSGECADDIIESMRRATAETVDDSELMQKAAKAMMMGFDGTQITKMAEMARIAARTTGEDVGAAFDNISNAISTGMPRALKQYGLITKDQMSLIEKAMNEGVEGVNLYNIAMSNLNVQQAKMGDLAVNSAEKLQQNKAAIEDAKESFGSFIAAVKDSALAFDNEPMVAYFEKMMGLQREDYDESVAITNQKKALAAAEAEAARNKVDEEIKASQQLLAQKKTELETLKAMNKEYFASQEESLKAWEAIQQAAGADDYKITQETIRRQAELNTEYYGRTKKEIEAEAAVRAKADRNKVSDATYTAQKLMALDAEVANRAKQLLQQKTLAAIQAAQNDVKNLTSKISDYQSYYDKLKALMDKNTEQEKAHFEQLKAIRQQQVDLDKSTDALISGIKGTSSSSDYATSRWNLSLQYGSALNLVGQDKIKALEEYKQAVASLQSQFSSGAGNGLVSAAKVASDAISDIERATQSQKLALGELTTATESQIAADQQWGMVLQSEAQTAQNEIEKLNYLISDLSAQIANMQTTITLTGVDRVSGVVDGIIADIERLHALANQPITLSVQYSNAIGYSDTYLSSMNTSSSLNLSSLNLAAGWSLTPYAEGTDYVPKTGPALLHQGEAVIPAAENKPGSRGITVGAININVPESAVRGGNFNNVDWRSIVRNQIMPEIKKLSS